MGRKATVVDLAKKVCKRGHEGEYVLRKDGSSACRVCSKLSSENHRGSHEARTQKLREKSEERLAELDIQVAKLKIQTDLLETERAFLIKTLAILTASK